MRIRARSWLVRRPLALAGVFYVLGMLVPAVVLRALWFDGWFYVGDLGMPSSAPVLVAGGGTLGLLVATPWLMRFEWTRRVAETITRVFGPFTLARAAWLGGLSGFCEELLFRGALQPMLGLLPASILFALVHPVAGWWAFALVVGIALGALYSWDGNLWPCVLAHALLNMVNLYRLSRVERDR